MKVKFLLFTFLLFFIATNIYGDSGVWIDGSQVGDTLRTLNDVDDSSIGNGKVLKYNSTTEMHEYAAESGGGAPTDVDYLVGTANGTLSAEIVVGTTPGGELGGTWASPTVDSSIHDDEYVELGDNFIGDVTGTYNATDITESILGVGGSDTLFPADPNDDQYLMWDDSESAFAFSSPAGSGDVESVGDCASGACLDGTSDGGTWIKFYDAQGAGQLITGDLTATRTWTFGDTDLTFDQNVQTTAAVTFATVDTGNGANELYSMDQDIQTSDSPTFAGLDLTEGNITNAGDIALDSLSTDGTTLTFSFDNAADIWHINQTDTTGTSAQYLISINDDRTGVNANNTSEATIGVDVEGVYWLYVLDGATYFGDDVIFAGTYTHLYDDKWLDFGQGNDHLWQWNTGGTSDDHFMFYTTPSASDSDAWVWTHDDINNTTDFDNFLQHTFILQNDGGADANDYSALSIGWRTENDVVTDAPIFGFFATTGANDGSVDATNTELAPMIRIGDSNSATSGHSLSSGDLLLEDDLEVDGWIYADGGLICGYILRVIDDQEFELGTAGEWNLWYNDGTDDQLILETTKTSAIAATDPMVYFIYDTGGSTMTANQEIFALGKGGNQASATKVFKVDEDGDLTITGTSEAATITESGNAVHNTSEYHAGTDPTTDLEEEVTEGSLADSTIISADIKDGVILSGDLSWDAALADGDYVTYDSTGTNFNPLSSAEVKADLAIVEADISDLAHTATAITDDLIVEADLNVDEAPADNDILTYDTTGANFSWQTPAELITAGTNISWSSMTLNVDDAFLLNSGDTLTGDLQLGEIDIKLDAVLSADEKWSGIIISGTLGATIVSGDLCYLNNDDSRWELADANLSDGYDKVLGICIDGGNDGDSTELLIYGRVRSAAFPAFTVGSPVYMSETAGDVTHTAPTTTDACVRIMGFAITAEDLLFNPSNDYYTHT